MTELHDTYGANVVDPLLLETVALEAPLVTPKEWGEQAREDIRNHD